MHCSWNPWGNGQGLTTHAPGWANADQAYRSCLQASGPCVNKQLSIVASYVACPPRVFDSFATYECNGKAVAAHVYSHQQRNARGQINTVAQSISLYRGAYPFSRHKIQGYLPLSRHAYVEAELSTTPDNIHPQC